MPITVVATGPQISAAVSEASISAAVSEGIVGATVGGGIGPAGPAGTTDYNELENVPSEFPPAAHSHTIADVTGLQAAIDSKAASSDARLSDAREWTASTVSQAEAEAGAATTRRAFTAQRIFQAVAAWWAASAAKTKLDGIESGATANQTDAHLLARANHTGTQAASTISDFTATAAAAAPVQSVAGRTGAVTLSAGDVSGLALIATTGSASDLIAGTVAPSRLPAATTTAAGSVVVGSGLGVTSGTVSADVRSVAGRTGDVTLAVGDVSNAVATSDSRLSDARTPTAHKASHATGGTDALTASDIGAAASTHTHAASDIASGTVATARLGSGTADATTFLRGDQTWAAASSTNASDLTAGTLANARLTTRSRASMNIFLWSAFR